MCYIFRMFDLQHIVRDIGWLGVVGLVFAETGLLIGFFLPGDSLLFTAGFLASQGLFDIQLLSWGCVLAAALGNVAAYAFGARVGRRLFDRPNSRFFRRDMLLKAHAFYERHGAPALVLARFIPAVRVFAPIVAGIGLMGYRKFTLVNLAGALLWGLGLTWGGYWLGRSIPNVDHYLLPIVLVIVFVSILPAILHVWNDPAQRAAVRAFFRRGAPPAP